MNRVMNVAYGFNASDIDKMSERQLIAAFFMADTNLPTVKLAYLDPIIHNMARVTDQIGVLAAGTITLSAI